MHPSSNSDALAGFRVSLFICRAPSCHHGWIWSSSCGLGYISHQNLHMRCLLSKRVSQFSSQGRSRLVVGKMVCLIYSLDFHLLSSFFVFHLVLFISY